MGDKAKLSLELPASMLRRNGEAVGCAIAGNGLVRFSVVIGGETLAFQGKLDECEFKRVANTKVVRFALEAAPDEANSSPVPSQPSEPDGTEEAEVIAAEIMKPTELP